MEIKPKYNCKALDDLELKNQKIINRYTKDNCKKALYNHITAHQTTIINLFPVLVCS